MAGRIKGNGIALGMRCDELSEELVITDADTLAEIKDRLDKLEHLVESIVFDLDLREEEENDNDNMPTLRSTRW